MQRAHVMTGGKWPVHMGFSSRKGSELDRNASELVNFDDGGSWAPSDPIKIGGAGLSLNAASVISGGITTKKGYGGKKPQIVLADQWPLFSAARAKTAVIPWTRSDGYGFHPVIFNRNGSLTKSKITGSGISSGMIISDHHMHDGATLTRATCSYRFTGPKPAAIGSEAFTIARFTRAADVRTELHTAGTVGGTVYTGSTASRVVATVEEFYGSGNVVSIVFEPDQNNGIDKATYYYAFIFSTNLDAEVFSVMVEFSVPDMKWE